MLLLLPHTVCSVLPASVRGQLCGITSSLAAVLWLRFLISLPKDYLTGESLTLGVSTALASLLGSAKIGNSVVTLATVCFLSEYFAVC